MTFGLTALTIEQNPPRASIRAAIVLPESCNCVLAPRFSDLNAPDAFPHDWANVGNELGDLPTLTRLLYMLAVLGSSFLEFCFR